MIESARRYYNAHYTEARYEAFLNDLEKTYGHLPPFRIAETPVFVPKSLEAKLVDAVERITDVIVAPDFKAKSENAVLAGQRMPNETSHTLFLQMDFGVCVNAKGEIEPQLIEVQGFPSLYFYQEAVAQLYRKHFAIPEGFDHLFGELTPEAYIEKLRQIIVGDHQPENVILLEIEPEKQTTAIDFIICKKWLGVPYVCVSDLKMEGSDVYYVNEKGRKIQVERIFNRVIFDELIQREDLQREFYFTKPANVEWIGHPHWFFRISKHTLPYLSDNPYVPNSYFLHELGRYPDDLENYVLKPLYSFAGSGVIINLNRHDLDAIKDPENYILQRKVSYAPVIDTPTGPTKCELRMLMLWERDTPRPVLVNNLARLTKGEMVGVKYNKNKTWVGGSIGFFED